MTVTDPMILSHERACPYCHQSMGDRVDADTHIVGCTERWRRQHHIDTPVTPGACPSVSRWSVPEPVAARIESTVEMARRITGESDPLSAAFRSLPAYEPAF